MDINDFKHSHEHFVCVCVCLCAFSFPNLWGGGGRFPTPNIPSAGQKEKMAHFNIDHLGLTFASLTRVAKLSIQPVVRGDVHHDKKKPIVCLR